MDKATTQYCEIDLERNPLPDSIFGLPCVDKCPDGHYATVDSVMKTMTCEKCPVNTYSVGGGGIRIDGTMGAFGFQGEDGNVMPLRMEASCQVHSNEYMEYLKNEDCMPWSRTGTSLKAYKSDVSDVLVDFDLTYPVYFDEEGSVQFKYRKDSIGTKETTYGVFKFIIDGEVQLTDDDLDQKGWQTITFD